MESVGSRALLCRGLVLFLTSRKSGGAKAKEESYSCSAIHTFLFPNSSTPTFSTGATLVYSSLKHSGDFMVHRRKLTYSQMLNSGLVKAYLIILVLLWTHSKILKFH